MRRILAVLLVAVVVALAPAGAALAEGETVQGTLRAGAPVAGVRISVAAPDGTAVGTATSAADGRWQVPVPAAGQYVVRLDTATLPPGITLAADVPAEQKVTVREGAFGAVLFRLSGGAAPVEETSKLDQVPQLAVEGLRLGLIIALASVGLSLVFGTTGLTNFAHGELVTIGAFVALVGNVGLGLPLAVAAVLAVLGGLAVGALADLAVWRPLRRRRAGLLAQMVVSIGLGMVLRYVLLLVIGGGGTRSYDVAGQTATEFGPVSITPRDLYAMGICAATLVGVAVMLRSTRLGRAMRAVADNRDLAAASGVDVERVILAVWACGGGLAALGGVILGWTTNLRWDMGFNLLLLMFAGTVLGGLGTAYGALAGGLVVGLFIQLSGLYLDGDLRNVIALAVLVVVLMVRPRGILGTRQRIG